MFSVTARFIAISFVVVVAGTGGAFGFIMPHVNLGEMCSNAELIVVGRITAVKETDQTLRLTRVLVKTRDLVLPTDGEIPADAKIRRDYLLGVHHATVAVQRVLKGTLSARELTLELPCQKTGDQTPMTFVMRLERVPRQGPMILCLCAHQKAPGLFKLANAYRSAIAIADVPAVAKLVSDAALPGMPQQQAGTLLAASLEEFSKTDKLKRALSDLINLQGRSASPALLKLLDQSQDAAVRGQALAALVEIGDYTRLADAVEFLVSRTEANNNVTYAQHDLSARLSMLTNAALVTNFYAPLMRHAADYIRRDAAYAYRHIQCRAALPLLAKGLDDSDQDVRYQSMMGLAETLNQFESGWAASTDLFRQNERDYLTRWKTWWQTKGQAEFAAPSPTNTSKRK